MIHDTLLVADQEQPAAADTVMLSDATVSSKPGAGGRNHIAALGDGEDLPANRDGACAQTSVVGLHVKAHRPIADCPWLRQ